MKSAFRLNVDQKGFGHLVFDLPGEKVNKFSPEVMIELESLLDKELQDKRIRALAIKSGKKDIFVAGADIGVLARIRTVEERKNRAAFVSYRIVDWIGAHPVAQAAAIALTMVFALVEGALWLRIGIG